MSKSILQRNFAVVLKKQLSSPTASHIRHFAASKGLLATSLEDILNNGMKLFGRNKKFSGADFRSSVKQSLKAAHRKKEIEDSKYFSQSQHITESGSKELSKVKGFRDGPASESDLGCDIFGTPLQSYCTFKYPSGNVYSGMWENGERHGKGVFKCKDGTVWTGSFHQNELNGAFEIKYPDGDRFSAEFVDGVCEGPGLLTRQDGSVQASEWENGVMKSSREMGKDWLLM